jgi:putative acetyltransferase
MNLKIHHVKPDDPGFTELIELLNQELWERNPGRQAEYVSHNILSPETRAILITDEDKPVASGAFRNLGDSTTEIKRMFVLPEYRGKGISKLVLSELESWAKEEGLTKAVLETGHPHFEAISLYKKWGYLEIENYGPYKNLPNSICMGKIL